MTKDKKKPAASGQATAEQIAKWKQKHGEIFEIGTAGKVCYLKKPGRKELSFASITGGEDPYKWNEAILESCWLGGDEEIKKDDELFLAASSKLTELVKIQESYIKKL